MIMQSKSEWPRGTDLSAVERRLEYFILFALLEVENSGKGTGRPSHFEIQILLFGFAE